MRHTRPQPTSTRHAAWILALTGVLVLAGCLDTPYADSNSEAPSTDEDTPSPDPQEEQDDTPPTPDASPDPEISEDVDDDPSEDTETEDTTVEDEPDVTEDPDEPDVTEDPDEPVVVDCSVCAQCGDGAAECQEICESVSGALEPEHAEGWWGCVREDPCQIERAWQCFDGLECEAERMVAAHCETMGRCATDGRGYFDEAACRADPYQEPKQWACLRPQQKEAVFQCLDTMACGDLAPCLNNAACAGDPGCTMIMSTRLAVDCHRICLRDSNECYNGERMRTCMTYCDEAAYRLGDAQRREVESCALEGQACSSSVIEMCAANIECQGAPLDDMLAAADGARTRCQAEPASETQLSNWACLGQVLRSNVEICMSDSPCGEMSDCLAQATCGDKPGCLDFLSLRQ